jgi:DNA-binding transcriptional LysR family regulator
MDTDRLRYFCTISKTGSLRKASEILNISPSALSKSLKLLEREIGRSLVAHSGRGFILTDAGIEVAKEAEDILRQISHLGQKNLDKKGEGPLKLGAFEVFTTYFLKLLFKLKKIKGPLTIYDLLPGQMEKALIERQIDIGITYLPVPMMGLDYTKVTSIEMGIFSKRGTFKKIPFEKIPFVIPVNPLFGAPNKVQGLDGWPDDHIHRHISYKVTLMESAIEICRQGLAAAYLPKFLISLHNEHILIDYHLDQVKFPEKFKKQFQDVYLVKRKSDIEDEHFMELFEILKNLGEESIK